MFLGQGRSPNPPVAALLLAFYVLVAKRLFCFVDEEDAANEVPFHALHICLHLFICKVPRNAQASCPEPPCSWKLPVLGSLYPLKP